ncbi:mandelate racemase/muconate lactonizing enzyme family protein [Vagococcus sp.]|uniref:mandelate racemase/muconate lactonizing enzyme family protein n=1 Tax=Vagococcus sp. TaxID=1933889 RepID=UPI003F9E3D85
MKITDVKTYIAGNEWKNWVFVEVETDIGVTGVGEATLNGFAKTVEAAIHEIKKFVIGKDPFDVEKNVLRLFRDNYSDGGQIHGSAISGIEYACMDIMGKYLEQPVYNLLGGRFNQKLRVYANGWYRSGTTSEELAKQARETVAKGYTALKFDPFGAAWKSMTMEEINIAMDNVRVVREAVGPDIDIMIEGHNRLSTHTAKLIANRLAPYQPTWFEAPVMPQRISNVSEVARYSPVPIACGEDFHTKDQFAELLMQDSVHIIQLEPQYLGLTAAKQVCAMAQAFNAVTAPHSAQGPLCSIAAAHLNTASPSFFVHEIFEDFNQEDWTQNVLTNQLKIVDGHIEVSDAPGWGTELNKEIIAEHPYQSNRYLPLFKKGWESRKPVSE